MTAILSFGYWGWGNSVPALVQAVDAAEHALGFKPPLWVDVRLSRSVRAVGFAGAAFSAAVGRKRYRWMPKLGNLAYRTPGKIKIAEPAEAVNLLECALERAAHRQRVIFFCACPFPCEGGKISCHRRKVAQLLIQSARKSGDAIQVVEWPGEPPALLECHTTPTLLRAVARGRMSLPFDALQPLPPCVLAWGSIVRLKAQDAVDLLVIVGAPKYRREWVLPVFRVAEVGQSLGRTMKVARRLRSERGLEPLFSRRGSGQASDNAVQQRPRDETEPTGT